jgi:hypothetical protein
MIRTERDWLDKVARKAPIVGVLLLLVGMANFLIGQPRDVILALLNGMMIGPIII